MLPITPAIRLVLMRDEELEVVGLTVLTVPCPGSCYPCKVGGIVDPDNLRTTHKNSLRAVLCLNANPSFVSKSSGQFRKLTLVERHLDFSSYQSNAHGKRTRSIPNHFG